MLAEGFVHGKYGARSAFWSSGRKTGDALRERVHHGCDSRRNALGLREDRQSRPRARPAALLVVEVLEGQQIAAYATLVDNVTNDATYLSSELGAKEEN